MNSPYALSVSDSISVFYCDILIPWSTYFKALWGILVYVQGTVFDVIAEFFVTVLGIPSAGKYFMFRYINVCTKIEK